MKEQEAYDTIEDLIANPEFRNWVLRPTSNAILFWEKWMEAHPEKKKLVYEAREFILSVSFKEDSLSKRDFDDVLQAIIGKQKPQISDHEKKSRWFVVGIKAAAAISLLAIAFYLGYQRSDEELITKETSTALHKENPKGQKSRFRLPDGTKVWLNSNSSISYEQLEGKRIVSLKGEAFFDVFRDTSRPFEVHSNDLVTSALGTSFNIAAYEGAAYVKVSLITGRVLVESEQNRLLKEILNPDEQVVFDRLENKLNKQPITDKKLFDWKDGVLYFKNATQQEVVDAIETWFGVELIFKNKASKIWKYNGEFKNKDLETVLSRISFVENFDFEIKENEVEIKFR